VAKAATAAMVPTPLHSCWDHDVIMMSASILLAFSCGIQFWNAIITTVIKSCLPY